MFYDDDINITKRKTITNGKPYDFFIYDLMPIEKEFDETKKFGKGDTVISKCKEFILLDYETGKKLIKLLYTIVQNRPVKIQPW